MSADLTVQILLGLLVLVVGFSGYITASRATRAQSASADKAVDAAAFERARQIYEGALETLRDELASCRSELLSARGEISGLRHELARVRAELERLHPETGPLPGPHPA